jgi:hypothetical protein
MDQRRPNAGFAIKVACTVQGAQAQLYLNFCHHPGIGMPVDQRGRPVQEDQLHRGVGFLRIPIDVGTWRKISASESSKLAYICDVIFCDVLIKKLMDDEYCKANAEFRPHLFELAMKTLESSLPSLRIERNVKLVKKTRYVNAIRTEGAYDLPEPFQELQGAAYDEPTPAPKPTPEPASEPIIEEVKQSGRKSKPIVKKGFFNTEKAKNAKPLYPEGSGEGVLPENAGDPLGYLPKGLRKTCKVVDCNNPEYQASLGQDKKPSGPATASYTQQKQMEKMFGNLPSFEKPSVFQEDNLLKDDDDGLGRYSNDYSRFDKMEEEEDEPAPTGPERDYYYDEKGNVVSLNAPKTTTAYPPDASTAGLKKGFLDGAQKPLYPPKGSQQGGDLGNLSDAEKDFVKEVDSVLAAAPHNQPKSDAKDPEMTKMMEQFAKLGGNEGDLDMAKVMQDIGNLSDAEKQFLAEMEPQMDAMNKSNGSAPGPRPDAPDVKKGFLLEQMAKEKARTERVPETGSTALEVPQYTIACNDDVRVVVTMPLVASIKVVDLDVATKTLRVQSPDYLLECDLPCRVDPAQAKASFKKATKELVITIPIGK